MPTKLILICSECRKVIGYRDLRSGSVEATLKVLAGRKFVWCSKCDSWKGLEPYNPLG